MKKYLLTFTILGSSSYVYAQDNTIEQIPVRLKSLEVSTTGLTNKLMWTVACFIQYAKFDIQRSYDAVHYATINSFQADRLRCLQPFDYEDKNSSGRVYYRVNVGDLDGKIFTSKIVTAYRNVSGFDINSITPTVVTAHAVVSISSASNDNAELSFVDIQGKMVFRKPITLVKGNNEITLNMAALANTSYFLIVRNSERTVRTARFIKQ